MHGGGDAWVRRPSSAYWDEGTAARRDAYRWGGTQGPAINLCGHAAPTSVWSARRNKGLGPKRPDLRRATCMCNARSSECLRRCEPGSKPLGCSGGRGRLPCARDGWTVQKDAGPERTRDKGRCGTKIGTAVQEVSPAAVTVRIHGGLGQSMMQHQCCPDVQPSVGPYRLRRLPHDAGDAHRTQSVPARQIRRVPFIPSGVP